MILMAFVIGIHQNMRHTFLSQGYLATLDIYHHTLTTNFQVQEDTITMAVTRAAMSHSLNYKFQKFRGLQNGT